MAAKIASRARSRAHSCAAFGQCIGLSLSKQASERVGSANERIAHAFRMRRPDAHNDVLLLLLLLLHTVFFPLPSPRSALVRKSVRVCFLCVCVRTRPKVTQKCQNGGASVVCNELCVCVRARALYFWQHIAAAAAKTEAV